MPEQPVREVTESGFKVSWPQSSSFRLAEMAPYKQLSGCCLKEMDVGWHDGTKGHLVLLELKGSELWQTFDRDKTAAHDHLVANLKGKATDVLLILASVWARTEVGAQLSLLLPAAARKFPGASKLKLIFLVDTPATRAPLLGPVKDELNRVLAGRTNLYGIKRVSLVDFDRAQAMGLPVTRV
jgi:hypothetical protein